MNKFAAAATPNIVRGDGSRGLCGSDIIESFEIRRVQRRAAPNTRRDPGRRNTSAIRTS